MDKPAKILFADDDAEIREVVRILLESEGYDIDEAADGQQALGLAGNSYDLVILDILMPGMGGFEACEQIRKKSNVPILFLTAKSGEDDKVRGLAVGGDDYLVKPFSSAELLARVQAMLRRYKEYGTEETAPDSNTLRFGSLSANIKTKEVRKNETIIELTDLEYGILLLLMQSRGRVFTAKEIYESVWDDLYFYQSNNTVMVHIRNLRKKLEDDPQRPRLIKTVWGKGYSIG